MERRPVLILMECDHCGRTWEQEAEDGPECVGCGKEGHKFVSEYTMGRMQLLMGQQTVSEERLLGAFMACTAGGEGFARAVLAKAVETGRIGRSEGKVWNGWF